jgi:hypothetical protein
MAHLYYLMANWPRKIKTFVSSYMTILYISLTSLNSVSDYAELVLSVLLYIMFTTGLRTINAT